MAWVKIEPNMPRHPKLVAAGPLGFALDVAAICYSNEYATDGFIADSVLVSVLPGLRNARKVAQQLVASGRWERDDITGGWWIHDVDDYQPTAADQEEERTKARDRMRKLRANRRGSGNVRPNTEERSCDVRNSDPTRPDPTRPDPTRTDPPVVDQPQQSLSRTADGAERDPRVIHALRLLADEDLDNARTTQDIRVPEKYRARCLRRRLNDDAPGLDAIATELPDATTEQLLKEHLERRYLA